MSIVNLLELKIDAIREVAALITSTSSFESISNLVLDLALKYTGARSGSILLLDSRGYLKIRAARGLDPALMHTVRVRIGDFICGRVAEDKTPLLVKDIQKVRLHSKKRAERYQTGSFICCPILLKDKLVGIININDKEDGTQFIENDLDLVMILSSQTALSVENARLISELQSKASTLDERNQGLIDSDRLKNEFISRMTHEIRTPLNSINGAAYYLKERKASREEQQEFVNIISDEAGKLISLLEELLNFSRLESDDIVFKKKIISLIEVIQETLSASILKQTLISNNVSIQVKLPDHVSYIVGEKVRLLQAFIYIVDGLIRHTQPADVIRLIVCEKKQSVMVDFVLKGRKIPEEIIASMFDERSIWHGIDVDKNNVKFYLAKHTLQIHNGAIYASNMSTGFRIRLDFPKNERVYVTSKINELLRSFLDFTAISMNLRRCSIMMMDNVSGLITIRHSLGIDEAVARNTSIRIGEKIAGMVVHNNEPMLIEDIERYPELKINKFPQYRTGSFLSLPIPVHGKAEGVLNLSDKLDGKIFTKEDLYLSCAITERISRTVEKIRQGDLKDEDFRAALKSMESLLSAGRQYRDKNGRFTSFVYKTMKSMSRDRNEMQKALYASKLYDLGLTQIDKTILDKTKPLTDIEKKIIQTHPFPGVRLIDSVEDDEDIKDIILYHHEKYDGSGYPYGVKGEQIPFISRILAVADSYTAMTSKRPYRNAMTKKESLHQIRAGAGTSYDPAIVEAFARVV
ncbi:MAG: GAF domain-containing protein [Nitrospiraceae bacterium]|nr:MAG: GAF domain-containing protein [Nitrospiraceae bacterium]